MTPAWRGIVAMGYASLFVCLSASLPNPLRFLVWGGFRNDQKRFHNATYRPFPCRQSFKTANGEIGRLKSSVMVGKA
jgi:superfamily II RNA helicase